MCTRWRCCPHKQVPLCHLSTRTPREDHLPGFWARACRGDWGNWRRMSMTRGWLTWSRKMQFFTRGRRFVNHSPLSQSSSVSPVSIVCKWIDTSKLKKLFFPKAPGGQWAYLSRNWLKYDPIIVLGNFCISYIVDSITAKNIFGPVPFGFSPPFPHSILNFSHKMAD